MRAQNDLDRVLVSFDSEIVSIGGDGADAYVLVCAVSRVNVAILV